MRNFNALFVFYSGTFNLVFARFTILSDHWPVTLQMVHLSCTNGEYIFFIHNTVMYLAANSRLFLDAKRWIVQWPNRYSTMYQYSMLLVECGCFFFIVFNKTPWFARYLLYSEAYILYWSLEYQMMSLIRPFKEWELLFQKLYLLV